MVQKLSKKKIEQYYPDPQAIALHLLTKVDSTNAYCLQQGELVYDKPLVCVAEQQTAGRGRLGKSWLSLPGGNLYFSYAQRVERMIPDYSTLSLSIGLIVINTLLELGVSKIGLKWPNDILSHKYEKFGGILIESVIDKLGFTMIVVGIGLNLNLSKTVFPDLNRKITALNYLTKQPISINSIIGNLIQQCLQVFTAYEQGQVDSKGLVSQWQKFDLLVGKKILLYNGLEKISGIYKGIDNQGRIKIEKDRMTSVYGCGEVTIAWK